MRESVTDLAMGPALKLPSQTISSYSSGPSGVLLVNASYATFVTKFCPVYDHFHVVSIDLIFEICTSWVSTTTFGYDLTLYCPPAQDQAECQLRTEPLTLSSVVHWLPDVAAPLPQRLL